MHFRTTIADLNTTILLHIYTNASSHPPLSPVNAKPNRNESRQPASTLHSRCVCFYVCLGLTKTHPSPVIFAHLRQRTAHLPPPRSCTAVARLQNSVHNTRRVLCERHNTNGHLYLSTTWCAMSIACACKMRPQTERASAINALTTAAQHCGALETYVFMHIYRYRIIY